MTHVQKYWTVGNVMACDPTVRCDKIQEIRTWLDSHRHLPKYLTDEQIFLFCHSCYFDAEMTKSCIEDYYKLRLRVPQFFEGRDIMLPNLQRALKVLHFGILPKKTSHNHQIVFHKLNDTDPTKYVFNDGFKLLAMMIDAVYIKEGPLPGLQILFDLTGVKIGHLTRLSLNSVRKCLEYIQDAIPIRLKGIHVLNVHPIIDKIMILIRPFLRKSFLGLIHFYKENDEEVYKVLPKSCLPNNYGGELESVQYYHEEFIKEMKRLRPLFLEEEELMFDRLNKCKSQFNDLTLGNLEID